MHPFAHFCIPVASPCQERYHVAQRLGCTGIDRGLWKGMRRAWQLVRNLLAFIRFGHQVEISILHGRSSIDLPSRTLADRKRNILGFGSNMFPEMMLSYYVRGPMERRRCERPLRRSRTTRRYTDSYGFDGEIFWSSMFRKTLHEF